MIDLDGLDSRPLARLCKLMLSSALVLALAVPAQGQSTSGPSGPSSTPSSSTSTLSGHGSGSAAEIAAASAAVTASTVKNIQAVRNECGQYDPVYRIDCLQQGLRQVAKRLPVSSEYRPMRALIEKAAGDLNRIVRANVDPAQPKLEAKPGANPRFKAKRTYTAIKKTALKKAMAQAAAIIDELETQLLRASENSEKRLQHYQQVAVAVGSTKVLLRS